VTDDVLGCDPPALALPLVMHVVVVRFILLGGRVEDGLHFIEEFVLRKVSLHDLLPTYCGKPADVGEAYSSTAHLHLRMARKRPRRLLGLLFG
jgi:hypothetical protein